MHHRQDAHQKGSDNSASARVSPQFQSRPFGLQAQSETTTPQQQETPDLQTQLERAKRFGPDFSRVRVRGEGPPPTIQPKLFFGEQRDQEEPVTDVIANPVRSMPAPRVNLPPIQRQDAQLVGMEPNPLAARMMPVVQRRDAEWVGNQPNLAARMMPVVQRRDAEWVGNQPNLAARMMPVVQRQPQPTVSIPRQPWIQRIEEQPEAKLEEEDESAPVQAKLENATVQRQSEANEEEEAEDSLPVQTKLENATVQRLPEVAQESEKEDHSMQLVQPKLVVGAPGDKYEQEADSMAVRVMSMTEATNPTAIQHSEAGEEDSVQRQPLADSITPLIQRQSEEEEDIQTKPSVQQAGRDGGVQASSSIENTLASQKGGGSPLDENVRSFMEPRFGNDFSSVRIHTGSNAVSMNKELHAQAFTHGSDVYFNEGKYNPGSNEGKQLLAHELTHVVQQMGAKQLQRKPLTKERSNKETLQAKISPASGAAIQLKESPGSAQEDPAFQAVVNKTKGVAEKQKAHPPAKAKSAEAQAAAQPPANEVESKAQDKQVQEMNQQQPGKFNAATFKGALMEKIAAITPNTLEEADKFKENNKIGSVKSEVSSKVTDEKKQASDPIENKTKEQPNTSGITPKPVTPLPPKEAGSKPGDVGATGAAPKPKDAEEVSLQEGSKSLDEQMASANVTEEQLKKSNEPEFQGAVSAKNAAQTDAAKAPAAYRQQEQGIVTQAQAIAQTTAATELQGMHGSKEQVLAKVLGNQTEAKGQDEQKRAEVANHIQGIYNNAKQKVEACLSQLDGEVNKDFDSGAAAAQKLFEDYVDQRMKRYKDERYSGLGAARWVTDKLFGMPSEVNAFYQEGKKQYLASMDKTIDKIANLVATKLNAAKQEITNGRQEIQKYVAGLDPSLRQVGQEAAQNIQSKFDELETSVDNKQNELVDSLAQKYNDNLKQLDDRIAQMKAENRGLVDKAKDAIGGVIKTILELKNMLMGVLAKAAGAIDKIITDPIGFLGNLISGIKQGFQNFAGNIWEHLKKGMLAFLTGALAGAGITMPESFELKGIFSLVMQVLGVVYDSIKSRVIKALGKNGEKMFSALESSFEMFVILKNEGIAGLWQFIQDKIGDLKAMVIDTIQNFVVESVIKAGVMWVLSLLNPASAFVRACKAIYDIIMFFIERGSQIAQLVNAVTESVSAIANGAVGGAAKLIENALGTSLPVVISFMASLLGLGGISEKIEGIIKTVRAPIDKAIDWLIAQAVKFAKKIGNKLGFGKDKKGNKDQESEGAAEKEHPQLAKQAIAELEKIDGEPKDYNTLRKEKEAQAKQIEQTYTAKLKPGIKLSVHFSDTAKDEKDGDLDFKVVIAPNTTEDEGTITVQGSKVKILVLGEFSFEYSNNLKTKLPVSGYDITTTTADTEEKVRDSESQSKATEHPFSIPKSEEGFSLKFEVFGQKLGEHFSGQKFNVIIVHSPHIENPPPGLSVTRANQQLLAAIMKEAKNFLAPEGRIHVVVGPRHPAHNFLKGKVKNLSEQGISGSTQVPFTDEYQYYENFMPRKSSGEAMGAPPNARWSAFIFEGEALGKLDDIFNGL
jgi:hypothetical protein